MTLLKILEIKLMSAPALAIFPLQLSVYEKARALAEELRLPLIFKENKAYDYWVVLSETSLGIKQSQSKARLIKVDFLSEDLRYRLHHASKKNERLIQALGADCQKKRVVDATGGLGHDSLLLAKTGAKVTLLERSPLIYQLLKDGLARAESALPLIEHIHLIHTDAITWLTATTETIDIVYLDPMFPEAKKSALSKMEMQILQSIIGQDEDANILFERALACATTRVVVKRPRKADFIAKSPTPSYSLTGSSSRFDIYLQSCPHPK